MADEVAANGQRSWLVRAVQKNDRRNHRMSEFLGSPPDPVIPSKLLSNSSRQAELGVDPTAVIGAC